MADFLELLFESELLFGDSAIGFCIDFGSQRSSFPTITLSSIGFATKSFIPSSRNISLAPSTALAVSAIMGTVS